MADEKFLWEYQTIITTEAVSITMLIAKIINQVTGLEISRAIMKTIRHLLYRIWISDSVDALIYSRV